MTHRAPRPPADVATAWPVGRPSGYRDSRSSRHSARIVGPPRRWIAPSTPPPPSSDELAALTMASARSAVMSPIFRLIFMTLTLLGDPLRPASHSGSSDVPQRAGLGIS